MYFHFETKSGSYRAYEGRGLSPTPHLHSHIEIILLHKGRTVATADSVDVQMEAGDLFISFPNQVHYYVDDLTTERGHDIAFISPDFCSEFSSMLKSMVPKLPIVKNAEGNPRIKAAVESLIQCTKSTDEYSETEARGCVLILMSEIFRNIELQEKVPYDNDLVKDIITYCYENYNSDISLQAIADELHVSRCYISRLFSRRLHIGFNDYINSLRVRNACEMLKSADTSVTEVAYAVGYNSVRTFDRAFLSVRGMTPKEYRQRAFEKKQK